MSLTKSDLEMIDACSLDLGCTMFADICQHSLTNLLAGVTSNHTACFSFIVVRLYFDHFKVKTTHCNHMQDYFKIYHESHNTTIIDNILNITHTDS